MEKYLYLKNIKELVTSKNISGKPVSGEALLDSSIIYDGGVIIKNDKILFVGETSKCDEEIKKIEGNIETIDCTGKVVTAGFVDSHTHAVFNESRETEFGMRIDGAQYLDILAGGGGIISSVNSIKKASIDELVEKAIPRLTKIFSYGTTTIEIKSGYGLYQKEELKMLEVIKKLKTILPMTIVPTYCGAHAIPMEYKKKSDIFLEECMEIMPTIKKEGLAEFNDIFIEKGVFTIEQGRKYLLKGIEAGLPAKFHADEIYPLGGAELAGEIGAVSADHLLAATKKGFEMMAEKNVIATFLPGTLYSLMKEKYPDFKMALATGVPMALGSDYNPGSNFSFNMQTLISQAAFLMKVPVQAAINMTTINGAHALKLGEGRGSIEVGKYGDLLIMDIPSHLYLGYHYGSNMVEKIIKNGKIYEVPEFRI